MFGNSKKSSGIDQEQLELIENAQRRIKQKKRLYIHFIIFLIGAILCLVANIVLGIGKEYTLFGIDWFAYVVIIWALFLIYHFVSVFITHKFLGKAWEKKQLDKLVDTQQKRLDELKSSLIDDEKEIARLQVQQDLEANESKKKAAPKLTIIAAVGEDNSLGKDNDLIWHLSKDLKRFKDLTSGHHIIMGRKTFESFQKPLPNRTHIVITRQENYEVPNGVIVVHNLNDALDAARSDHKPYIIGGGEIYKQALPLADEIELTRVHAEFENADTFFPEIDMSRWKIVNLVKHEADANHDYDFSFITLKKQ